MTTPALFGAVPDLGARVLAEPAANLACFGDSLRLDLLKVHRQLEPHTAIWVLCELNGRVLERLRVGGPDRDPGASGHRHRESTSSGLGSTGLSAAGRARAAAPASVALSSHW